MKKLISDFFRCIFFDITLLVMSFAQGMFSPELMVFSLAFIYSIILLIALKNPFISSIFTIFLSGLILDSVNDILLGTSSLVFMCMYFLSYLEVTLTKVKHFINLYLFFILNNLLLCGIFGFINLFTDLGFISLIYYLSYAIICFPILYFISFIYSIIYLRNHEI